MVLRFGSGKSTLLRGIATKFGGRVVDLDDAATLAEIRAGSDAPLTWRGLIAVDEFQRAPEVLSTVKRVVDRQAGVSRFLLAGSVSDRLLPKGTETLTGRVQRVTLLPLSAGEVLGQPRSSIWPRWVNGSRSNHRQFGTYLTLLERCFLLDELPSWSVGVSARAGRRAKLHVVDTGLVASSIHADARKLSRLPFGGALVESFVVSELRKQAAVIDEPLSFAHFRDHSGVEVDVIIERPDGTVVGIEVKAATLSGGSEAKGLRFLRDVLGDRFTCGVVMQTGPLTVQLEDRIWATPIPALWGGGGIVPGATGLGSDRMDG